MRNTKKVATVFTGAAACAAAFTPAAQAATTTPANNELIRANAPHNCAVGPAAASVTLTWPASKHHGPTCVNQFGYTKINADFTNFCAGNYSGLVEISGSWSTFTAGTVSGGTAPRLINSIYISHRGANFRCPT